MAQGKSRVNTEDNQRESDEEVWRAIRYLDPDSVNRQTIAIVFASVAIVILLSAVALWLGR